MLRATGTADSSRRRIPPGPAPHFLLGNVRELRSQGLPFVVDIRQRYGDVACYHVLRWRMYLVSHPDSVEHVLKSNYRNYNKDSFAYRRIRLVLGNGLLTSDGNHWRRQRRLAAPAFHRKRVAGLGEVMISATLDMVQNWESHAADQRVIDLGNEMKRLTFRIAGETLFGNDLTNESDAVGGALTAGLHLVGGLIRNPFAPPLWVPTPGNLRFQKMLQLMDKVVYDIIAERRRAPDDRGDLLSMFMLAEDEDTGEQMNDQQLRDEVLTMLLAGHETSANALTWTGYLLSRHPAAEAKLRAELDGVLAGRVPTMDDLPQLPYSRMVLQEAMRLYPPVYAFHRTAMAEDEVGGYTIPPGQILSISPYIVHRHPDFWPDPETFDPERFAPEREAAQHRFAYIPFAAGPRQCIASNFAFAEMQLAVAIIAQRYRLQLVPGQTIKPHMVVTLRPRYGIKVTLEALR